MVDNLLSLRSELVKSFRLVLELFFNSNSCWGKKNNVNNQKSLMMNEKKKKNKYREKKGLL